MPGHDICREISVIGGVYKELCYWPIWDCVYGSGWRSVRVLRAFCPEATISFYTVGDEQIEKMLKTYAVSEKLNHCLTKSDTTISFCYNHPLAQPIIQGQYHNRCCLQAEGPFVIGFGMLEATAKIKGEYVVYDPQSPQHPVSFKEQGGQAEHLALVMNENEAKKLSGENELSLIKRTLFDKENCECLVIKCGAKGAYAYNSADDDGIQIPVFKTKHVWPIGSGDVFTTVFSYCWFNGCAPADAAMKASKAVAVYCDNCGFIEDIPNVLQRGASFEAFSPQKQGLVYLAGPFFTLHEKLFVSECRNLLCSMGVDVFSPYHDVGEGKADDVAPKDIEKLKDSDCVLALIDGLDSGTLFEVGYAVSLGKKVVAYVENETEGSLKMLAGTGCDIESDFTTAIYKACWYASE